MQAIVLKFIDLLGVLAIICIAAVALLTGADIVLRDTLGSPVSGLVDLTQLAMMYAVFLSIAYGFARRIHVAVTVVTDFLPPRISHALAALWWFLAIWLLLVMGYAALGQARLILAYGDVSQNLEIPMILYWLPVVAGLALAALGSLWSFASEMRDRRRMVHKGRS